MYDERKGLCVALYDGMAFEKVKVINYCVTRSVQVLVRG